MRKPPKKALQLMADNVLSGADEYPQGLKNWRVTLAAWLIAAPVFVFLFVFGFLGVFYYVKKFYWR